MIPTSMTVVGLTWSKIDSRSCAIVNRVYIGVAAAGRWRHQAAALRGSGAQGHEALVLGDAGRDQPTDPSPLLRVVGQLGKPSE